MAVVRQPLAVTDVEAQMVSLVGGWILVLMQQDHEADVSSDRHGHIGLSHDGHRQSAAVHRDRGVTGQHHPVPPVQDDFLRRHLDVGAFRTIHHDGDGAEVGSLLFVAAGRSWGAD